MAFSYQRKQTVIIAIICIVIVVGTIVYTYWPSLDKTDQQNAVTNGVVGTDISLGSSTNTGISGDDWKKAFFTVSSSTDSAYKVGGASSSTTEVLSQTDMLGREFFTAYAQLKQAGLTGDTNAINSAANLVVANAVARIPSPATYEAKDLKTINSDDTAVLTAYGSRLSTILKTNFPATNETTIVSDAIDSDDMTILKQIDPLITKYQATLVALVTMDVPRSLASYHVNLLNGVSMQLFNSQSLRNLEADPVRGLAAVNMEVPALEAISTSLSKIKSYLGTKGISFTY